MEKTIAPYNNPLRRLPYLPPELDVYEYVVEKGFEGSTRKLIGDNETVSEIQDPTTRGGAGENYHGEWF